MVQPVLPRLLPGLIECGAPMGAPLGLPHQIQPEHGRISTTGWARSALCRVLPLLHRIPPYSQGTPVAGLLPAPGSWHLQFPRAWEVLHIPASLSFCNSSYPTHAVPRLSRGSVAFLSQGEWTLCIPVLLVFWRLLHSRGSLMRMEPQASSYLLPFLEQCLALRQ